MSIRTAAPASPDGTLDDGHARETFADRPSQAPAMTYRCPRCGLDMKIEQRQVGAVLVYAQDVWRQGCRALHLGSPAYCLSEQVCG